MLDQHEYSKQVIEDQHKLVMYLRGLADAIEQRGITYSDVDENFEVIETEESAVIKTYRHGPRLWLSITIDWADIPIGGKGGSDKIVKQ